MWIEEAEADGALHTASHMLPLYPEQNSSNITHGRWQSRQIDHGNKKITRKWWKSKSMTCDESPNFVIFVRVCNLPCLFWLLSFSRCHFFFFRLDASNEVICIMWRSLHAYRAHNTLVSWRFRHRLGEMKETILVEAFSMYIRGWQDRALSVEYLTSIMTIVIDVISHQSIRKRKPSRWRWCCHMELSLCQAVICTKDHLRNT